MKYGKPFCGGFNAKGVVGFKRNILLEHINVQIREYANMQIKLVYGCLAEFEIHFF